MRARVLLWKVSNKNLLPCRYKIKKHFICTFIKDHVRTIFPMVLIIMSTWVAHGKLFTHGPGQWAQLVDNRIVVVTIPPYIGYIPTISCILTAKNRSSHCKNVLIVLYNFLQVSERFEGLLMWCQIKLSLGIDLGIEFLLRLSLYTSL